MDLFLKLDEQPQSSVAKTTPSSKEASPKAEQHTATRLEGRDPAEHQHIRIRNELFAMFTHPSLKGKIKVQDFENLSEVEVTLYHRIKHYSVQQNVRIIFSPDYPAEPPKLEIYPCSLSTLHPDYIIPNFLTHHELLTKEKWTEAIQLSDVLAGVMNNLEGFHASEIDRLLTRPSQREEQDQCQLKREDSKGEENSLERQVVKHRRKSSNMTGCADKQLTQTKNLNRHFRSKLRQVLRDSVQNPEEMNENYEIIDRIFTPNRVGFQDIRRALSNKWFNATVRRQMNSGQFLHKILRGMMGIKSKKLMIKYYHVMVSAVEEPLSFTRWKYD